MNETWAWVIWLLLLALAIPYVRMAKHPETQTMAAYLLFVMVFSVISATAYFLALWFVVKTGSAETLANPFGALLFLVVVFVPAFLCARWVIKRPSWRRPVPK
jgi:uncharacterized membrane protein